MSDVTLGTKPGDDAARDAIHVAVVPAIAAVRLKPGQRVGMLDGNTFGPASDVLGVVDPYLTEAVPKGGKFWLCLLPNTVTGMRHHWTHPLFDDSFDGRSESEVWLRNYAVRMNSYDGKELAFERLIDGLRSGDLYAHGTDLHGFYDVDDAEELRRHAEAYLSKRIDFEHFTFSCSC